MELELPADCIVQMEDDIHGLEMLRDCLMNPTLNLTSVDLMWNRIGKYSA